MKPHVLRPVVLALASLAISLPALAAGYQETVSGDLSNNRKAPTAVKLKPGSNTISGKFGTVVKAGGNKTDRDYFTITIAPGQTLDSIVLDPATQVGGSRSFIAVQAGPVITMPPDGGSPADLLGWSHFDTGDEGTDILPAIGLGPGAIGFTPPLGEGVYSFWVQELSVCKCRYDLKFIVGTTTD